MSIPGLPPNGDSQAGVCSLYISTCRKRSFCGAGRRTTNIPANDKTLLRPVFKHRSAACVTNRLQSATRFARQGLTQLVKPLVTSLTGSANVAKAGVGLAPPPWNTFYWCEHKTRGAGEAQGRLPAHLNTKKSGDGDCQQQPADWGGRCSHFAPFDKSRAGS
jgi:hypothetical protein